MHFLRKVVTVKSVETFRNEWEIKGMKVWHNEQEGIP